MALEERKTVELSGRDFVLTPLNLLDMQLLEKIGVDAQAGTITARDSIVQTAEIIFRSAQVANPSLKSDDVKRCLTLRNFPRAMKALLQVSGLVAEDAPEEQKKTESPASESTGTTSTEPSSPQPDGVSIPSIS
jgi:hypothetical protein